MPLTVNLHQLESGPVRLRGVSPSAELAIDRMDELIHPDAKLDYDLEVQRMEDGLLAQGRLRLVLHCECSRCLRPFDLPLDLPEWAAHLPLEGEDKVAVSGEVVDLTPQIREDILLQFPQRPLCEPECRGLSSPPAGSQSGTAVTRSAEAPSPWAALDKLKLKD
jgi:uncharacterized protein